MPTTTVDSYKVPADSRNIVIDDKVYITKQGNAFYNDTKFGASNIGTAGCAIMAVYNLLKYLNKDIKFAQLIYYFEKQNLVFGALGAWPSHLKKLFNKLGINYYLTYDEDDLDKFNISNYDAVVPTYFHHKFDINANTNDNFGLEDMNHHLLAHTTFVQKIRSYIGKKDNKIDEINNKKPWFAQVT